jgi:DNA-binding MarR family transcriptional regulator
MRVMSRTHVASVLSSSLPPAERLILLVLLTRQSVLPPSVATISSESGLSPRTVIRAVRSLSEGGWLRVERGHRADGGTAPNEYAVTPP